MAVDLGVDPAQRLVAFGHQLTFGPIDLQKGNLFDFVVAGQGGVGFVGAALGVEHVEVGCAAVLEGSPGQGQGLVGLGLGALEFRRARPGGGKRLRGRMFVT